MVVEVQIKALAARIAQEFKTVRTEISTQSAASSSSIDITAAPYNCVGNWDKATQTGKDNTAGLQAAFDAAHAQGKRVFIPGKGGIHTTGEFYGSVDITDKNVLGDANNLGFIAQPKAKSALKITRTFNPARSVTAVRHIWLPSSDTDAPDSEHVVLDVARADLQADMLRREDSIWVFSDTYFKDPAKDATAGAGLGAAEFNGEVGRKTYMAEWVDVLGIGVEITDLGGSGGVREAQVVRGALSGATASVSSSVVSAGGPRIAILTNIKNGAGGFFQAGENLVTFDTGSDVIRGNITTGKNPFIVGKKRLKFPMTENIRYARLTDRELQTDLTGIRTVASDDTDDYNTLSANRAPAIDLWGVVRGTGTPYIKSSWKMGIANNGGHLNKFIVTGNMLPNYGADTPSGFGYLVEDKGGASGNDYQLFGTGGRHAYTTNTRPTLGTTAEYEYMITKGVAHDNVIHDSRLSGYLDAALDTHAGSVDITFRDNYIDAQTSGGRGTSRSAAIQLRGFGHRVYGNHIINAVNGVRIIGHQFAPYFDVEDRLFDNKFENITGRVFDITPTSKGSETYGKSRISIKRTDAQMITRAGNPNVLDGIVMTFGRLRLVDFDLIGHNGAAGRFGVLDELVIQGGQIDFGKSPAGSRNFLLDTGVIPYLVMDGMSFIAGPNGIGTSIFRVLNGQTIRASTWAAHSAPGSTGGSQIPLWTSVAGTATVYPIIQGTISQSTVTGLETALASKAPMPVVLAAGAPVPAGPYLEGQLYVEVTTNAA